MIIFSAPSRGQQVLTPLGSEQTTSLLVVLISLLGPHLGWGAPGGASKGAESPLAQAEFTSAEQVQSPPGSPKGLPFGGRKKCGLKAARRAPQFSKR